MKAEKKGDREIDKQSGRKEENIIRGNKKKEGTNERSEEGRKEER